MIRHAKTEIVNFNLKRSPEKFKQKKAESDKN